MHTEVVNAYRCATSKQSRALPLSWGSTLPTALAAPVDEGMMLAPAPRPPRQSLEEGHNLKLKANSQGGSSYCSFKR
jgi:hypothetical protein